MIGGSVTLASSSPFDDPVIDPALLASPLDTAIWSKGYECTTSHDFQHIL